jgi:hypothetical protein
MEWSESLSEKVRRIGSRSSCGILRSSVLALRSRQFYILRLNPSTHSRGSTVEFRGFRVQWASLRKAEEIENLLANISRNADRSGIEFEQMSSPAFNTFTNDETISNTGHRSRSKPRFRNTSHSPTGCRSDRNVSHGCVLRWNPITCL